MSKTKHSQKDKTQPILTYPLNGDAQGYLQEQVITQLKTIYDPEIPLNVYDLGLIYQVSVDSHGMVFIKMTLTSMSCPFAHTLPGIVEKAVNQVEGVIDTVVDLVWDPPWTMSEAVRVHLGLA
jgi:FeS assembly SUF system protein